MVWVRPVGVERGRLAEVADPEDAALLLGARVDGDAGDGQGGDGQDDGHRREELPVRHAAPPEAVGESEWTRCPAYVRRSGPSRTVAECRALPPVYFSSHTL